jgi:hypothetical protein
MCLSALAPRGAFLLSVSFQPLWAPTHVGVIDNLPNFRDINCKVDSTDAIIQDSSGPPAHLTTRSVWGAPVLILSSMRRADCLSPKTA